MAELAAVADIPPAPRTPEDILAALFVPAGPGGPAHFCPISHSLTPTIVPLLLKPRVTCLDAGVQRPAGMERLDGRQRRRSHIG